MKELNILGSLDGKSIKMLTVTGRLQVQECQIYHFKTAGLCCKHHRHMRKLDAVITNQDTDIYHVYRDMNNQISLCSM